MTEVNEGSPEPTEGADVPEVVDETTVEATAEEQPDNPEEGQDTSEETTAEPEPKKAKGVQKRIDELTQLRRDAERDRDYWRQVAMQHSQQAQQPQPEQYQQPQEADPLDEYDPKVIAQRVRQQIEAENRATDLQQKAITAMEKVSSDPDARRIFDDQSLPITDTMTDILLNSDHVDKVAGHLGRNPNEVFRLAALPSHLQAYELARIEREVSTPAPVKPTGAPAPIPTVGARGTPERDPATMSTEEWMKHRNQQLRGQS